MSKIGLIIKREYLTRVKKKSFLVMTILGPLLMVGVMVAAVYLTLQEKDKYNILLVDDTYVLSDSFKSSGKLNWQPYNGKGMDNAVKEFKDGEYDLIVYLPPNIVSTDKGIGNMYYKEPPSSVIERKIHEQVKDAWVKNILQNDSIFNKINKGVDLTILPINDYYDPEAKDKKTGAREKATVGFIFAIIVYFFIFFYGTQVMRGVIEEKTNRIVEVIVSSVKPFQLMMGKIIGVGLVALTQFLIWVILTYGIFTIVMTVVLPDLTSPEQVADGGQQSVQMMMSGGADVKVGSELFELITGINWFLMLGSFLFYFLGGYLLYSSIFAAIAAAVDNETDTQQFMMPVTIPLILGFIVAQTTIQNPASFVSSIFSQIPFTSPVVMLVRIAMGTSGEAGTVTILEVILSMILLIGTFLIMVWFAAKIYRVGILMYGKKPSYKELWKWIRQS